MKETIFLVASVTVMFLKERISLVISYIMRPFHWWFVIMRPFSLVVSGIAIFWKETISLVVFVMVMLLKERISLVVSVIPVFLKEVFDLQFLLSNHFER